MLELITAILFLLGGALLGHRPTTSPSRPTASFFTPVDICPITATSFVAGPFTQSTIDYQDWHHQSFQYALTFTNPSALCHTRPVTSFDLPTARPAADYSDWHAQNPKNTSIVVQLSALIVALFIAIAGHVASRVFMQSPIADHPPTVPVQEDELEQAQALVEEPIPFDFVGPLIWTEDHADSHIDPETYTQGDIDRLNGTIVSQADEIEHLKTALKAALAAKTSANNVARLAESERASAAKELLCARRSTAHHKRARTKAEDKLKEQKKKASDFESQLIQERNDQSRLRANANECRRLYTGSHDIILRKDEEIQTLTAAAEKESERTTTIIDRLQKDLRKALTEKHAFSAEADSLKGKVKFAEAQQAFFATRMAAESIRLRPLEEDLKAAQEEKARLQDENDRMFKELEAARTVFAVMQKENDTLNDHWCSSESLREANFDQHRKELDDLRRQLSDKDLELDGLLKECETWAATVTSLRPPPKTSAGTQTEPEEAEITPFRVDPKPTTVRKPLHTVTTPTRNSKKTYASNSYCKPGTSSSGTVWSPVKTRRTPVKGQDRVARATFFFGKQKPIAYDESPPPAPIIDLEPPRYPTFTLPSPPQMLKVSLAEHQARLLRSSNKENDQDLASKPIKLKFDGRHPNAR